MQGGGVVKKRRKEPTLQDKKAKVPNANIRHHKGIEHKKYAPQVFLN